jgi:hypothetical protein
MGLPLLKQKHSKISIGTDKKKIKGKCAYQIDRPGVIVGEIKDCPAVDVVRDP